MIGNLQKAIEDDPGFDENVIARSDAKNKYFLNDPIPISEEKNGKFPAWYGRSIEDIILDSSSIQETFLYNIKKNFKFFLIFIKLKREKELLFNLEITSEESARTCTPHRHIVFLKKHKCASSTIFEILNRFKKKHKLYAASKPLASFVGGYPGKFKPEFVAPPQVSQYHFEKTSELAVTLFKS